MHVLYPHPDCKPFCVCSALRVQHRCWMKNCWWLIDKAKIISFSLRVLQPSSSMSSRLKRLVWEPLSPFCPSFLLPCWLFQNLWLCGEFWLVWDKTTTRCEWERKGETRHGMFLGCIRPLKWKHWSILERTQARKPADPGSEPYTPSISCESLEKLLKITRNLFLHL